MVQKFVDVSSYTTVDWAAYSTWSSMVAMKSSEGAGYVDPAFSSHRAGALQAGINSIWYYHFSRPDLGNSPIDEANSQYRTVGAIRPQDCIVLDFEAQDPRATAQWAYQFLQQQEANYGGKLPEIYAGNAYILARLQDSRLARYPLWLADWTYDPSVLPPCPAPWKAYIGLQYSDRATNIPGISGKVDADIFIGGIPPMATPVGWSDNGTTLFGSNGIPITLGFRTYVLSHSWDPGNVPLKPVEARTPILMSNPTLGGGTRQEFRDGLLVWTSATNVFSGPAGQELAAVEKALATMVTPATISTAINQATATLTQLQQHANQVVSDITSAQAILSQLKP